MWISACANFTLLICFIVCSLARCLVSHKLLVFFTCDVNCLLLWYTCIWKSSWTRRKHGNSLGKVSCQTGVTFSIDVSRVGNWQGVLSPPVILSSWDWQGVLSVSLNLCWYFMFQISKFFNRLPVLVFNQINKARKALHLIETTQGFACQHKQLEGGLAWLWAPAAVTRVWSLDLNSDPSLVTSVPSMLIRSLISVPGTR